MTIAEYIADQLVNAGVRWVFGIPGGPSIPYMEAFRTAGIEFILTSNESAAAIRVLTADSEEKMKIAVNVALSLDEPVIINAIIDPEDYKWLIVKPK